MLHTSFRVNLHSTVSMNAKELLDRSWRHTVSLTVCYYHAKYEFQSEYTPYSLPECQSTPFSKQAPYLMFKLQQRDSKPQPLRKGTLNHLAKLNLFKWMSCILFAWCIWLYVIIMSCSSFGLNHIYIYNMYIYIYIIYIYIFIDR